MSNKQNKSRHLRPSADDQVAILTRISRLLEILVRLNLESIRAGRSQTDMVGVLGSVGCGQTEIANLLGTTSNTVSTALARAKKKNRKK
jgi:CRP-like cAMP-binding protein